MTTDFRALCAELEEAYTWCIEEYMTAPAEQDTLIQRARAALAQPEPEGPTNLELSQLYCELFKLQSSPTNLGTAPARFAHAVLARWGNHPGSPV